MKQIYLEGSKLSYDVASGISNYIANLVRNFKRYEHQYDFRTTVGFLNKVPRENVFYADVSDLVGSDFTINSYATFVGHVVAGTLRFDLFHSPYMFLPPKSRDRINLLTVHDTINLERPFSVRSQVRDIMLRRSIVRANFLICISESTKERLKSHFPHLRDDSIFVIYQGIDDIFFSAVSPVEQQEVGRPYLLYVGQRGDYKNFESLLDFASKSNAAKDFGILCVGGGMFSSEELRKIAKLNLTNRVFHAGYVSNDVLKSIYKNAVALAYTSLHEGFGLPILEAMAVGCPVICGNFSAMKEIADGHAALVDDFSIDSMEMALQRVLETDQRDLANAAAYARRFSWKKTAIETLQAYAMVLNQS